MAQYEALGGYDHEAQYLESQVRQVVACNQPDFQRLALRNIPGYLGMGSVSIAFLLSNRELTLKLGMAAFIYDDVFVFDAHRKSMELSVQALEQGQGLARVEQLHSYDLQNVSGDTPQDVPAIITKYVPGQTLNSTPTDKLPTSARPYRRLAQTWCAMEDRDLTSDGGRGNIIYDNAKGSFTIIDYYRMDDTNRRYTAAETALAFSDLIIPENLHELPPAVFTFRDVCRRRFGRATATAIEDQWKHRGLTQNKR